MEPKCKCGRDAVKEVDKGPSKHLDIFRIKEWMCAQCYEKYLANKSANSILAQKRY